VLLEELKLANKAVPGKPQIAILGYVLLDARDEKLHLYATDLEVAIDTDCEARVFEPGRVALPMEKFLGLVERFEDSDVEIHSDTNSVLVKCGGFKTKLQTLSPDDFPARPAVEGQQSRFDAQNLRDAITKTRYAIASAGPVSVLKGALLAMSGATGAMVATDTKRIAIAGIPPQNSPDMRVIIPGKTLDLLSDQADIGELELVAGERHLFFTVGTRRITSRVIDAEFPKYERAIPRNHDKVVTVSRVDLAAALRRVVFISEDDQAIFITLGTNTIRLDAASASVGSADEVVACSYSGSPLKVCVNGSYVLNFLEVAQAPAVTVSFRTEKDPMMITDGPNHISVILLIRR
jgi:DNA polymerase-3 subunit beta